MDNFLKFYKNKIEVDGYITINYLCGCGEIHSVMFLYNKDVANCVIKNNNHIIIIDENNRYLTCNRCSSTTDLFSVYLAMTEEKGYSIQNVDETKLTN